MAVRRLFAERWHQPALHHHHVAGVLECGGEAAGTWRGLAGAVPPFGSHPQPFAAVDVGNKYDKYHYNFYNVYVVT